ncbi:hypothetical protein BDF20DRAFT_911749 [Mycotypha africana]|uniref:uncharacterized protein n=1 Tax=Mycotypha africana TaxID=64632 RepID=UPI002301C382|nr:uncharacterized protein BDF20DRAFT_911749 [Mycotypha africana]KAI8984674.1 hypothetical protein BDF20DRAFT_911749 [Mycotypha africana]
MSHATRGSRVVFVGNIPFELSEEQLIDVFKEVGHVASFRLLFDRETGRPKGYGFCEFYDAETAASAVRNLNDYEIGGRQLRVDYAAMDDNQNRANNANRHHQHHHGGPSHTQQQQQPPSAPLPHQQQPPMHPSQQGMPSAPQNMPMQQHAIPMQPMQQGIPPHLQQQQQLPVHQPVPPLQQQQPLPSVQQQSPMVSNPHLSSVDEISKVLASMNAQDLFTLMSQMKQMSFERPDFTKEFLTTNPQVAYALFQAMVMMNIVDPSIITRVMTTATVPQQSPAVAPQQQLPPQQPPPVQQQATPIIQSQQPQQPLLPQVPMAGTPTMGQSQPMQPMMDDPEQQKQLLMKVLQLTDEQINALPPHTRDQIRQLKSQLTMQQ